MFLVRKKISTLSDEELIIKYQKKKDAKWIGELFNRYSHLVYGLCLKYASQQDEAQDSVMEVFENLLEKLKNTKPDNFSSWLYVVAKNHCLMKIRKAKKDEKLMEVISNESDEDDDEILIKQKKERDIEALELAIAGLKDEQQVCIKLFFMEEKSYNEVAEMTGYDLKKVKSYIQNGKRMLKNQLDR